MAGSINPIRVIRPNVKRSRFARVGELPPNVRPFRPGRDKLDEPDDGIITSRRGLTFPKDFRAQLEARAVPLSTVYGSVHERIIYRELNKRQIPFDFQSSFYGARSKGSPLGGLIADFVLIDRPMVINPLGRIWHEGREAEMRDILQSDELLKRGYETEFVWDYVVESVELLRDWFRSRIDFRLPFFTIQDGTRFNGRK